MPAIVLMPFVFLLGQYSSQTIFSIMLGATNTVLVYLLFKKLEFSTKSALAVTAFFAFGTNHWYLASVGSAWFIAHITALFFLLLALLELFAKQRLLLIGLLLGASFWSRTTVIFTVFFFYIYLMKRFLPLNKKHFYNFLLFNTGILLFVLLDALYNFLRFNNFSPFSPYQLIPGIASDPIFQKGFMNISYIPRHITAIFFSVPLVQSTWPFFIPSLYSAALWFTSPALVYIFKAKKSQLVIACWVAIIATLLVISLWGGVGFAQFGYRFAQDFMPFLLILLAIGIGNKPSKIFYFLLILSILVNAWGVILINKLNMYVI